MFVRNVLIGLFVALTLALPGAVRADSHLLPIPAVGEDGLHTQPWFHQSFLDLNEDLAEANAAGKRLVIVWEQKGCPYCKRMHEVNLRIPATVDYIRNNFMVLQLNLWGDREVTDFDGEVLKEKDLAGKWGVLFTPTTIFYPESVAEVAGRPGQSAEVLRIPGYFKPFHFHFLYRYARTKGYVEQPNFQRWLGGIGDRLDELKVEYDLYADELPDLPDEFLH